MNRQCDSCTECCTLLGIHELEKEPLDDCFHCTVGVRCNVYQARPKECRNFDCLWLINLNVPEELKPNKSHVVLSHLNLDVKKQLGLEIEQGREIVVVTTDPKHPNAYKEGQMRDFLNALLAEGTELILVKDEKRTLMKWGKIED